MEMVCMAWVREGCFLWYCRRTPTMQRGWFSTAELGGTAREMASKRARTLLSSAAALVRWGGGYFQEKFGAAFGSSEMISSAATFIKIPFPHKSRQRKLLQHWTCKATSHTETNTVLLLNHFLSLLHPCCSLPASAPPQQVWMMLTSLAASFWRWDTDTGAFFQQNHHLQTALVLRSFSFPRSSWVRKRKRGPG